MRIPSGTWRAIPWLGTASFMNAVRSNCPQSRLMGSNGRRLRSQLASWEMPARAMSDVLGRWKRAGYLRQGNQKLKATAKSTRPSAFTPTGQRTKEYPICQGIERSPPKGEPIFAPILRCAVKTRRRNGCRLDTAAAQKPIKNFHLARHPSLESQRFTDASAFGEESNGLNESS